MYFSGYMGLWQFFTTECILLEWGKAESTKIVLQQLAEDVRERVELERTSDGKSKVVVSSVKFLLVL